MAVSGMRGKVYYIDDSCPAVNCNDFGGAPNGAQECWNDEVTKFTIVDSVQKREYGHDKSKGWQDVCAGIRRMGITLDAMLGPAPEGNVTPPLHAGRVLYLQLYPTGPNCSTAMAGYAMIDQVSYTYDQERGEPISYSMTLSSKGPWTGVADTGDWGGFECLNCGSSSSG